MLLFQDDEEICELAPEMGPCEAYFEQYFYNSTSETCEKFIYGGCQGNKNRFTSIDECDKKCGNQSELCTFQEYFLSKVKPPVVS